MQDTLDRRIAKGESLTQDERGSLSALLGSGCRKDTKERLYRMTGYIPHVPNYGIYSRVEFKNGGCYYCAGQSYPDEIRTVRNLLLGRE